MCALLVLVLVASTRGSARAAGDMPDPEPMVLSPVRSEVLSLGCGANLITIFGNGDESRDVPLVSVLDDTLGDDDPANDQLRYVWVFSYCPPSLSQRVQASIPFLYHNFSRRPATTDAGAPPPVLFDFSRPSDSLWRRVAWYAMQASLLDPRGWVLQAASRTYSRNEREYRQAHLQKGLSILSLYRESSDDARAESLSTLFEDAEFEQVYARIVEDGLAGAFLDSRQLSDVYRRDTAASRERTGRNWELLRQRCEEQGLYFEPLPGPPARAEHAIVWVSRDDVLGSAPDRRFDGRFLNISSPWSDRALRSWEGYSRTRFVDADGRLVDPDAPGARPAEMIPLAVYGLDFPKIPALLVDFRSVFNPKRRELSRRALDDAGQFLLKSTPIGDIQYFIVHKLYRTFTGHTGRDIDQPSRVRPYAQLKSLLVLKDLFEPELRAIVLRDLERMNLNPLQNDLEAERSLAATQYQALVAQAHSGALDRHIERDRSRERTDLAHGRLGSGLLRLTHYASLGLYTHHDDGADDVERYRVGRALRRHARLLEEVAGAPPPIEVTWDPARYREALEFVARHGDAGGAKLAASVEAIFKGSSQDDVRQLALEALHRIDDPVAKRALYAISRDETVATALRTRSSELLRQPANAPKRGEPGRASPYPRGGLAY